MNDKDLHIVLLVAEEMPQQIFDMYETELRTEGLKLEIDKFPFQTPRACLEWALPTIVGVYILKPYFDGFLKEMSKDHYNVLKNWLKKTATDLRAIRVYTTTASQSKDKNKSENTQSKVFSITSISNTGEHLKFMFDDKLNDEDWKVGIELLLNLLEEHFSNGIDDRLTIEIKNNESGREIFCRLKTGDLDWEILDYRKIVQEEMQKRSGVK